MHRNNLKSLTNLVEHYLTYNLSVQKHQVELLGGFSLIKSSNSQALAFGMQNIAAQV